MAGGLEPRNGETFQEAFARIEAAVDAGEADLSQLGFWRLLKKVKAEPMLAQHWSEQAGRIDRKAFEAHVKLRFPVWFGNLVLLLGTLFGAAAVVAAIRLSNQVVAGLALMVAAVVWSVSVHSPTHWAVGRAVGIRFLCYFFGGPFPPRPGLKIDYSTYLRTRPRARAWMHASGALATKVAPFVALAFWWASDAPAWAAWAVAALGVVQILTDVFLSTRSSDWKKVRRERALARLSAWRSA